MELDYTKIDNIEFSGINHNDCPDYCDAFIESADYDGRPMTEDELEWVNEYENNDFKYEKLEEYLH